jgi:hypothetical protein
MKNAYKLVISLLFIFLILPNLALASWWNPFSWSIFHKLVKTEVIKIATTTPVVKENTYNKLIEDKNKLKQIINSKVNENDINKLIVEKNALKQKIDAQTKNDELIAKLELQAQQTNTLYEQQATQQKTILNISSVSVTTQKDSARISWQTNLPTISKVFVGDFKVVNSESGLSTKHLATINNLVSNTSYNYEIEAIKESDVVKYEGTFKSEIFIAIPLQIVRINLNDNNLRIEANKEIDINSIKIYKHVFSSDIKTGDCTGTVAGQTEICYDGTNNQLLPILVTLSSLRVGISDGGYLYLVTLSNGVKDYVESLSLSYQRRISYTISFKSKEDEEYKSIGSCYLLSEEEAKNIANNTYGGSDTTVINLMNHCQ